ncbi:hypothetical protein NKH77_23220 [Streptomyces sp. M19]
MSLGTLGGPDEARLLLNLEAVPGIVSLTGAEADRTAVFASVAAELATNGWSDRLTVTLVGFGHELGRSPRPGSGTSRTSPRWWRPWRRRPGSGAGARRRRARLGAHRPYGPPPAHPARAAPGAAGRRAHRRAGRRAGRAGGGLRAAGHRLPHRHRARRSARRHVGVGDHRRRAAAGPLLGLELKAQLLPVSQHRAVAELFAAADPDAGPRPAGRTRTAPTRSPPPPRRSWWTSARRAARRCTRAWSDRTRSWAWTPRRRAQPAVARGAGVAAAAPRGRPPAGARLGAVPRGATEDVRDALIERLRGWLGNDPDGTRGWAATRAAGSPSPRPSSPTWTCCAPCTTRPPRAAAPAARPCASGCSPTPWPSRAARCWPTARRAATGG